MVSPITAVPRRLFLGPALAVSCLLAIVAAGLEVAKWRAQRAGLYNKHAHTVGRPGSGGDDKTAATAV